MQNYPAKEKWRKLSLDVGDQSQVGVNETKPNQTTNQSWQFYSL